MCCRDFRAVCVSRFDFIILISLLMIIFFQLKLFTSLHGSSLAVREISEPSNALIILLPCLGCDDDTEYINLHNMLLPSLNTHYKAGELTICFLVEDLRPGWSLSFSNVTEVFRVHNTPVHFKLINVAKYFLPSERQLAFKSIHCVNVYIGYKMMCHFFVRSLFHIPELSTFKYLWRMDSDSQLTAPVFRDPFSAMVTDSAVYGFNIIQPDGCCHGIGSTFLNWIASMNRFFLLAPRFNVSTYEPVCLLYYSNFEIYDAAYFRTDPLYNSWVDYVLLDGGIFRSRWGDHLIKSIFIKALLNTSKVRCMNDIIPGYSHQKAQAAECYNL